MLFATLLLAAGSASVTAHMNMYHPSMYGWKDLLAGRITSNGGNKPGANDWVSPMLDYPLNQWWFRGFSNRATGGAVMALPAGGSVTIEHACHLAWTSYGDGTTKVGSRLDACPGNAGAYHSNAGNEADPNVNIRAVSGCALAIADVDDVHKANQNNMVVFSVNHKCIQQKMTSFKIPKAMPACTGKKCICAWLWTAANGTANFYHSGFDCKVTNVSPQARKIGKPSTPKFSRGGKGVSGPKTPLYTYNQGILASRKIPWIGNYDRPGYHASWSFPNDGAQNDIFTGRTSTKPRKTKKKGSSFVGKHTKKTHRKRPRQLYTLEGVSDFGTADEPDVEDAQLMDGSDDAEGLDS